MIDQERKKLKLGKREFIAMGIVSCDMEFNAGMIPGDVINLTLGWSLKIWKSVGTPKKAEMLKLLYRRKDQKSQGTEPAMMGLLYMARKPTNWLCSVESSEDTSLTKTIRNLLMRKHQHS